MLFVVLLVHVSREVRLCGNDGRQTGPGLHRSAMVLALGLRVREACMYALQANPTVVQNDEHILARGLHPGLWLWGGGVARHSALDYLSGFFVCACACACVCIYALACCLSPICDTSDLTLRMQCF